MKILVTGGAGFIGSHLAKRLVSDGHSLAVLDSFHDFYPRAIKESNIAAFAKDVELHEGDICDGDLVAKLVGGGKFDAIAHIAARAGVRPSIQDPAAYIETNIRGTLNLLEAARTAGVPRFVFASSSSVYGLAKTVPFSESLALPQTLSPYAATKLAAEQLCGNYAHLHGLRAVCLRYFTVYGPGQRPDLAIHKFTAAIHHNEPIPQFGDGSTRRDYTYIDDIIDGTVAAFSYEGLPFDIFNLGENETTTLAELIGLIGKTLGKAPRIERLPEQPGDMPLTCADISKARAQLGYAPKTPISEGIPKFVEWFLQKEGAR